MRRLFTLICLLGLALPAGISITGCYRNPAAKYCDVTSGYGLLTTQVQSIFLQPQEAGISLAYGQTTQAQSPTAESCTGATISVSSKSFTWGTTNNQLVDISPTGQICAGTWNRNTGGGIPDYTICNFPNPAPSTGGLPYAVAYITATADSVTSNPVAVYVHAPVTSVTLAAIGSSGQLILPQQCVSQGQVAQLDAQACYAGANNRQTLLCAPSTVTSANSACPLPTVTPDIIASGTFVSPPPATGNIVLGSYTSGGTVTGVAGQYCNVSGFNNGSSGAVATVALSGANTISGGTALTFSAGGSGATSPPTSATLSNGTATCSGTVTVATALGPIAGTAGQTCQLTNFNHGSAGSSATVTLTGTNTIAGGTPLVILNGGLNATSPPTTATLSSGTAACSGVATVATTMTPVPDCTASIGTLSFTVGTSSIASINSTNNQITAEQPGTTVITASIAGSGSSAGYFSTCPPASITVTLANGATSGTVTQGVPQNLTTSVVDSNGNPITGLALSYQSTNPIDITAGSGGTITTNYPGVASVNAICQPSICNPAPIDAFGLNGTGLSLSSNAVNITTPGTASDFVWFGAPGVSQYFVPVELVTGILGSTVRLPYVPNSMVMDRTGANLYFGSAHELMTFSTLSDAISSQNTLTPGVVLAVAPDNSKILVNDQARHLFYLINSSTSGSTSGSTTTFAGMGNAAQWTPDAQTLYITDNSELNTPASCGTALITGHTDTLYVYNANTGWSTYPLPPSPLPPSEIPTCTTQPNTAPPSVQQTPAIMIPSVGAYLRGATTVAHTWCPSGTVGNAATIQYYPLGDSEAVQSDALAATFEGHHILGAEWNAGNTITLSDLSISIPGTTLASGVTIPSACSETTTAPGVQTLSPLTITPTAVHQLPVTGVNATAVNQVVTGSTPVPVSGSAGASLGFITYDGSTGGATLPYYLPASGGAVGTLGSVTLSDCPPTAAGYPCNSTITAPIAGAFSPDNTLFFVSTSGDNMIHYITIPSTIGPSSKPVDSQQVSPNLPGCDPSTDAGCVNTGTPGAVVPATVIVAKPRSVT